MSTAINDHGRLFILGVGDWRDTPNHPAPGMSLRQHLAGLAMAALLGREDTLANGAEAVMFRELARLSYAQADAMIAEGVAK